MLGDFILTILLVILNGFFVAAEFSIIKVRASQLDVKASKGSKRAKLAQHIVSKLDSYLSATQLGITIASLALGSVGDKVMHEFVVGIIDKFHIVLSEGAKHNISFALALTLITAMHVIFGEQIPKMIGIRYSLETTMFVSWPMRVFYAVFSPFIWLLHKLSNFFLRIMGIKPANEDEVHSEEELRMILTESEEGGAIKQSEHELIQNVFDFDDRIVKQIMVPQNRVEAIDVSMSKDSVTKKIIDEGYSRLPVYQGDIDNVIGIIHSKDLLKALLENKFTGIKDIMRPAHHIPENMMVNDLLRDFQKLHIQIAIVTNEFGATAGIVTMEDIIEELVGEIQDEHDEEKPNVEQVSDTEFIIKAHANILDVNESLPIAFPESASYETISGYINHIFGRIPAVNEKRILEGYEITILQRKKSVIELIKLKVLEA